MGAALDQSFQTEDETGAGAGADEDTGAGAGADDQLFQTEDETGAGAGFVVVTGAGADELQSFHTEDETGAGAGLVVVVTGAGFVDVVHTAHVADVVVVGLTGVGVVAGKIVRAYFMIKQYIINLLVVQSDQVTGTVVVTLTGVLDVVVVPERVCQPISKHDGRSFPRNRPWG